MTAQPTGSCQPPRRRSPASGLVLPALLGWLGWASVGCSEGAAPSSTRADVFTVSRDNLRISVVESAEILAAQSTHIKNEMEGNSTIIYLIEEGKFVEKGEKLVELDASGLQERKATQAIALERARAALISAEENLKIEREDLARNVLAGQNKHKVALIDRDKFYGQSHASGSHDMGEREQQSIDARANIKLAEAELKLAENRLAWSKKLFEKGHITRDELERDQLDLDRRDKSLTVARNQLDMLEKFTHQKEQITIEQAIREAESELKAIEARGNAKIAAAVAEVESRKKELALAQERDDNLAKQIRSATILAPTRGLVVYASEDNWRGRQSMVEEGAQVHERQELIVLPDVSRMVANLKVHEASVDKVALGQRAEVRVDAFPGEKFTGTVSRVSPIADSGSRWSNSDLKVYKTTVDLDGENKLLRPGMSASVEILIDELPQVLFVPLPAIHRQRAVTYVWLDTPPGPQARRVKLGQNNTRFAVIESGLEQGDRVFLATPEGAVVPEWPDPPKDPLLQGSAAPATDPAVGQAPAPTTDPGSESRRPPDPNSDAPGTAGTTDPAERPRGARRDSPSLAALRTALEKKHPALAAKLAEDRRALFSGEELRQAIEADDELRALRDQMMAEFRAMAPAGEGGRPRRDGAPAGENNGR